MNVLGSLLRAFAPPPSPLSFSVAAPSHLHRSRLLRRCLLAASPSCFRVSLSPLVACLSRVCPPSPLLISPAVLLQLCSWPCPFGLVAAGSPLCADRLPLHPIGCFRGRSLALALIAFRVRTPPSPPGFSLSSLPRAAPNGLLAVAAVRAGVPRRLCCSFAGWAAWGHLGFWPGSVHAPLLSSFALRALGARPVVGLALVVPSLAPRHSFPAPDGGASFLFLPRHLPPPARRPGARLVRVCLSPLLFRFVSLFLAALSFPPLAPPLFRVLRRRRFPYTFLRLCRPPDLLSPSAFSPPLSSFHCAQLLRPLACSAPSHSSPSTPWFALFFPLFRCVRCSSAYGFFSFLPAPSVGAPVFPFLFLFPLPRPPQVGLFLRHFPFALIALARWWASSCLPPRFRALA